jgi:hypothetical protein
MARCFDVRTLSDLDPVTFFIVTELMRAEQEERERKAACGSREVEILFELEPQVA